MDTGSNDREANRLSGRVRRYGQTGRAMSGLAARVAGQRFLGIKIDNPKHAVELRHALGGIKGPLMKIAQILATIPDALPQAYTEELRQLQSNAPAMGWPFVKRRMNAELGAGWQQHFRNFEHEAAAAASLGQVHRAALNDGARVACKLQYPEMSSTVEADLRQLRFVLQLYRRYDESIDTSKIYEELAERLREELDYQREGQNARLYAHMLRHEPGVHVPMMQDGLSTRRLLTLNWLEGKHLMEFRTANLEARNQIAYNMFRAWYVPFYEFGVIHGDPHLGNYTVRDDYGINLLDFGCIRVFPPRFVKAVIDLYFALRDGDDERAVEAYRSWGFHNLNKATIDVLNLWARFLYKPLMEDKTQKIQEQESGLYGATVAAEVHAGLKRVGGVTPPREFVLMDRAAIGLGSVFMHLRAEINWHTLFHRLIGDFDVDRLRERQNAALHHAGLASDSIED